MKAQLDELSVIKANAQFWEQMLAMKLETMPVAGEFCLKAGHISGVVVLEGVWQGRIEVRLAGGLAYEATAAMMMQGVNELAEADVLDAAKEIANMIAGTIKSSLPRPCSMTVPHSAIEAEGFCRPLQTENALMVTFRHGTGDLMVRILEEACMAG
jgi:CheY-specific phosphatase CheX